jgi:hypothetical protein
MVRKMFVWLAIPVLGFLGIQSTGVPLAEAGLNCEGAYGPPAPCYKWVLEYNPFGRPYCAQAPAASGTACSDPSTCTTSGQCNGEGTCERWGAGAHWDTCDQTPKNLTLVDWPCQCIDYQCYDWNPNVGLEKDTNGYCALTAH